MRCNQCGANLKRNMTFCNQCGAKAEAVPFSVKGFFSQFFTKKSEKQAGENQPENSGESTENSRIQGGSIWGKRAKLIYTASAVVLLAGGIAGGYFYENQQILNRQATSKQKEEEKDSRAKEEYQKIEKLESEIKDFVAKAEEEKRIAYEKANPKFPVEEKDLEIIWIPQEVMDRYDYISEKMVDGTILVGKRADKDNYTAEKGRENIWQAAWLATDDTGFSSFYTAVKKMEYGLIDSKGVEIMPCVYRNYKAEEGYEDKNFSFFPLPKIEGNVLFQNRENYLTGLVENAEQRMAIAASQYFPNIYPIVYESQGIGTYMLEIKNQMIEKLIPFSNQNMYEGYSYTGKQGFIDEFGNIIVPAVFDKVEYFSDGYAYVEKDGKKGFLKNPLPEERRK